MLLLRVHFQILDVSKDYHLIDNKNRYLNPSVIEMASRVQFIHQSQYSQLYLPFLTSVLCTPEPLNWVRCIHSLTVVLSRQKTIGDSWEIPIVFLFPWHSNAGSVSLSRWRPTLPEASICSSAQSPVACLGLGLMLICCI